MQNTGKRIFAKTYRTYIDSAVEKRVMKRIARKALRRAAKDVDVPLMPDAAYRPHWWN